MATPDLIGPKHGLSSITLHHHRRLHQQTLQEDKHNGDSQTLKEMIDDFIPSTKISQIKLKENCECDWGLASF